MRKILTLAFGAIALSGVTTASAAPPEGIHGGGTLAFGNQSLHVAVSATRLPNGEIAGHINNFASGAGLLADVRVQARPEYLQVTEHTACVVGAITRFSGWPFPNPPLQVVVLIFDETLNPGGSGPQHGGVVWWETQIPDFAHACERTLPQSEVVRGNFKILGG